MASMSCPDKYKSMGTFHEYYNGSKKAPILTIFIGGNHEASNYLRELYYGGWVAPNIYYLGNSGVIDLVSESGEKLTLGGVSGIEQIFDYKKGLYEDIPLT